jgi:hypothetical protein
VQVLLEPLALLPELLQLVPPLVLLLKRHLLRVLLLCVS